MVTTRGLDRAGIKTVSVTETQAERSATTRTVIHGIATLRLTEAVAQTQTVTFGMDGSLDIL